MNLRNKRKTSSSTSEEKEFQISLNEQTNSTNTTNSGSTPIGVPSPKKQSAVNGGSNYPKTNDSILSQGMSTTKKLKTNSGSGHIQQHTICMKSAEQIIQHQQNINNDCDIDNDGFREIFPQDLHSQVQEAILSEQVIVLRNAAGSEGYNINPKSLFGYQNVVNNHGDMEIECRIQNPTVYGFNVENPKNFQHIYRTTISEYGEYAQLLDDDRYEEIKKKSYYKDYFSKLTNGVMFAVNIDMDDMNWKNENMRLRSSLPHYLLNKGKHDMLSYHRQNVMGCTQPQMYLKVAGVWTGGHQENISVRAININHGDGESDWYCIDYNQVEKYRNFIKKKYSVDIHQNEGLWFGKYNDPEVIKAGIRIKKVVQRKNDIVILAPGVLHWVRCRGRSVQTAWNFAYRRIEDIIAMNDRFLYNQKINFQTIILNKVLFMDLLNFEYHNLPIEVSKKLYEIVLDYYQKETDLENAILHQPLKSKNQVIFYDQLPAQLRHIQIYYCSEINCTKEIFCHFGILRSQFVFQEQTKDQTNEFCGKYYCPQCIFEMKKIDDQIVVFRKFDLNSLKTLLQRVYNYNLKNGQEQPLYPISDLSNVGHFCGQIQNINDFIFNKDVRRLEQVNIPDIFTQQGVEEMQKFQLDLQSDRLIDFNEKPILKYVTSIHSQRCEDIGMEIQKYDDNPIIPEYIVKKEEYIPKAIKIPIQEQPNKSDMNVSQQKDTSDEKTEKPEQHDEQLALYLQQQENSLSVRTTRQTKNNSQHLIPTDSTLPTQSAITTLRGGKSICSRKQTQAQKKKNPSIILSQSNTPSTKESLNESQKSQEIQSPSSSSTATGTLNNSNNSNTNNNNNTSNSNISNGCNNNSSASPFINGQQIVKAKKNKIDNDTLALSPCVLTCEDTQMQIENPPSTPKSQIQQKQSVDETNNNIVSSNSKSNGNIKIISSSTNNSSSSASKSQETKSQVQIQKNKIVSRLVDDDEDDEEDEQVRIQKKQREQQKLRNLQMFEQNRKEEEELKLLNQQKEKGKAHLSEQKYPYERARSPSSDNDDTGIIFKKKLTLKHIANPN